MSERTYVARRDAALFALSAIATIGLAACGHGKGPATPESPTAGVVGGHTITVLEVDGVIKDALFDRAFPAEDEARLFEARSAALDQIVDEEVVRRAARGSDLAPDEWLAAEVETRMPVTDADVDAFWAQYEDRIPKDLPEDRTRSDIRAYLLEERTRALVTELRQAAAVRILLARPRFEVEPRGVARGPSDAPVTIIEFSDFQCPYCLRVRPTLESLLARYPEQVRLFYRHLPLPGHPRARPAAIASVCAERQGRFWTYHDLLFDNQGALSDADLRSYAEQLELDLALFDACLSSPEAAARIDEDLAAAEALGVSGTPAFFVNGVPLKGAQPESGFVTLIEEELALASDGRVAAQPRPEPE